MQLLRAWRIGAVAAAIGLVGGIVGVSSRRRHHSTAAQIMKLNDEAFGAFLHSTGLDAKVEAVMARRRRAAR